MSKSHSDVMDIVTACADQNLFAPWFRSPTTWAGWFVFLRALFGLRLTPKQLALFRECTGRTTAQTEAATEGWLIVGRRGGKSFVMALCAVYLACFRDYRQFLQPGERATVMLVATDREAGARHLPVHTRAVDGRSNVGADAGSRAGREFRFEQFRHH
jgi:hypothetical protein